MTRWAPLLIAGLLFARAADAGAAVHYVVSPEAGFGNLPAAPYTSPQTAAATVGAAMSVSAAGDTIRVAGRADSPLGYGENFTLRAGVALLGGYSVDGNDPAFTVRDADVHVSVLDGTSSGTVVTIAAGADRSTVIDGFVIREGLAGRGGGIYANGASPTIRGNTFYLNATTSPITGGGGAIRLELGANALLDGNTFARNTSQGANGSGAIHVFSSDPVITNNIFFQDLAGAGIRCEGASSPDVRFNDFFGNVGGRVAGCAGITDSVLALGGNIFTDPLFCDIDAGRFTLFDESRAVGAGEGGRTIGANGTGCHARNKFVSTGGAGIFPFSTPLGASRNIAAVLAVTSPGDTVRVAGGDYAERFVVPPGVVLIGSWNAQFTARRVAGEVSVLSDTTGSGSIVTFAPDGGVRATLDGFVVTGGVAGQGSAIRITSASPLLRGLSLLLNENAGGAGGVIHVEGGSPEIVNTLIALNRGAGVSCAGGASPSIHNAGFFGNSGGATTGCPGALPPTVLFADPEFCEAVGCTVGVGNLPCRYADGDFHLFAESPYSMAADDGGVVGALTVRCNRSAHYVSGTGTELFPYTTIAGAARDISDALAVASPGDTVRVAAGTYSGIVQMRPGVRIEGGWSAGFGARNPTANVTTIVGNVAGMGAVLAQGNDVAEGALLTGFTITHAPGIDGPGVEVFDAAPVITGNVITGNTTTREGAGLIVEISAGGNGVAPTITNNTVHANRTTSGNGFRAGGLFVRSGVTPDKVLITLSVTNNIFYKNLGGAGISSCDFVGGGLPANSIAGNLLFGNEGGDVPCPFFGSNTIADPLFCDYDAGDITLCYDSPARISGSGNVVRGARGVGCICQPHTFFVRPGSGNPLFPYATGDFAAARFSDIAAFVKPGDIVRFSAGNIQEPVEFIPGVQYYGNYQPDFGARTSETNLNGGRTRRLVTIPPGADSTLVIDGFTLSNGSAVQGGGMYVSAGASPIIRNVRFVSNQADSGGAALYCAPGSSPRVRFCFFSQNRIPFPKSSIVTLDGSSAEISNCTFRNNATIGIDILSDSPTVFNNILSRNDRGGIRCAPASTPDVGQNDAFANDDFNYSGCGSDSVLAANQNIAEDPLFCNEDSGDFTIFDHSPAAAGRGGLPLGSFGIGCTTNQHFVSSAGTGAYPFASPATATTRLQDAIDLAGRRSRATIPFRQGVGERDTVFIATGVYNEDITIPKNVVLFGGYPPDFGLVPGRSFDARVRDPILYPVIVRGTGTRSVAIVDSGGDRRETVIDGLAFRGGRAERGGGIFMRPRAGATIRNCSVDSSSASIAGGGLYISAPSQSCVFQFFSAYRDSAPAGAAVYADSISENARVDFAACTFVGNVAGEGGGAMEFGFYSSTLDRILFACNQAVGLKIARGARADRIIRSLFWENAPADTMLPIALRTTGSLANRFGDPRFCDKSAGDLSVYYKSPAVLLPNARPLNEEVIGRFPVGCTDPGHIFLVRCGNVGVYPFPGPLSAAGTIQAAIDRSQPGDTVRVAGGQCRENVSISDQIVLQGGWSTNFATQNASLNRTTIMPLTQGTTLRVEPLPGIEIDTSSVVDGFFIESGDAGLDNGGGILCVDASPKITNNVIRRNSTQNFGGGICSIRSKDQVIRGNTISENRAAHGGGIYLGDCEAPIVTQNTLSNNRADVRGAGIRMAQHSGAARIHDNTLSGNRGEGISFAGEDRAPDGTQGPSEIYNNIISLSSRAGLEHYPSPAGEPLPKQDHNLHWGNGGGNFVETAAGEGDLFLDPLFCNVDSSNFRLQSCSPAIGGGRDSADSIVGSLGNLDTGFFCPDSLRPVVTIGFLKNSVVPRFLDVYVSFSERVIDSTIVALRICENQSSQPLVLDRAGEQATVYGARGLETSGCGVLEVAVSAADACRNTAVFSRSVATAVVAPGGSAALTSPDGAARLEIDEARAQRESIVLLATAPSPAEAGGDDPVLAALGEPVGAAYELIGATDLAGPGVSLWFRLPAGVAAADAGGLAVVRRLGAGWARVESAFDAASGAIVAHPEADGLFRLVKTGDASSSPVLPSRLALHASVPNPSPGAARIAFDLPARARATLRVYDASGRRVATLVDETLPQGRHAVAWLGTDASGRRMPSGVYFTELRAAGLTETRKLILVR